MPHLRNNFKEYIAKTTWYTPEYKTAAEATLQEHGDAGITRASLNAVDASDALFPTGKPH